MKGQQMLYSFDLSDPGGAYVATRYPDSCAVGGDWVCRADSDAEALALAKRAAFDEWAAPDDRPWDEFEVTFTDSAARQ